MLIKAAGQIFTSNQLEFEENFFQLRKEEFVAKLDDVDEKIDIIYYKVSNPIQWFA